MTDEQDLPATDAPETPEVAEAVVGAENDSDVAAAAAADEQSADSDASAESETTAHSETTADSGISADAELSEDADLNTEAASTEDGEVPADDDEAMGRRPTAEVKSIIEALIFASPDPLSFKAIVKLLDGESKEDIQAALAALKEDYERPGGLQLVEVAGGYQIVTRSDLHEWVRRLFHERSTQRLSVASLETLAVVAYRQPVTAIEVADIRGVNTSGVMNTLLERHLIKIVGRKQVVGRPFMYSTTKEFLIRFGLNDLTDLPKVEDMAEALGIENPLLVEKEPLDEQLPLQEEEAVIVADEAGDYDENSSS